MVKGSLATILALALATLLAQHTGNGATPENLSDSVPGRHRKTSGIRFVHNNGAFGKRFLPETMGNPASPSLITTTTGWPDIFLVNGMDWPRPRSEALTLPSSITQHNHDGNLHRRNS